LLQAAAATANSAAEIIHALHLDYLYIWLAALLVPFGIPMPNCIDSTTLSVVVTPTVHLQKAM